MDFEIAQRVFRALEQEGVQYAVFGGMALNFHGIARFTEGIDLFVAPQRENIEALKRALFAVFEDPEIDQITADDMLGSYPAIEYVPPSGEFHLDLLTRLGNAFSFDQLEIERIRLGDSDVSVVSPRTLYRMKRDTVRLRDRADAELIRERFGAEVE
ncbi:MAG TPA: nucleotidyl transferase AbiEii/AbiGii toxin family protein [Thermoanaerobaculia bacterium]|nr:nucleotidyl transferase AbiEii/AbiGii toxin family protein [Thermoanaerobaculia bacterium]